MLHTCTESALARLDDQALRFSPSPLPPLAPPTRQPEYRSLLPLRVFPYSRDDDSPCPSSSLGLRGQSPSRPCISEQATVWICYKSVCSRGADRTPRVQVRALRNVVASLSLALSPVLSVFCILLLVLSIGAASRSPTHTSRTARTVRCAVRIASKQLASLPKCLSTFRPFFSPHFLPPFPHPAPLQADL